MTYFDGVFSVFWHFLFVFGTEEERDFPACKNVFPEYKAHANNAEKLRCNDLCSFTPYSYPPNSPKNFLSENSDAFWCFLTKYF